MTTQSQDTTSREHFVVYAGTTSHRRETLDDALWLAKSLARNERNVSIDRFWLADDPDEGPDTLFSEEIWAA